MPETSEEGARDTLVRIRRAVAGHSFGEGQADALGVSAGWISYPSPGILNPEDLLARAESVLLARKHPNSEVAA
jgi:GGDEF domain-containing protein